MVLNVNIAQSACLCGVCLVGNLGGGIWWTRCLGLLLLRRRPCLLCREGDLLMKCLTLQMMTSPHPLTRPPHLSAPLQRTTGYKSKVRFTPRVFAGVGGEQGGGWRRAVCNVLGHSWADWNDKTNPQTCCLYKSPCQSWWPWCCKTVWAVLLLILVMRAACFIPAGVLIMSDMLIIFVNPRHVIPVHLYIVAPTFVQFCSLPPNSAVIGCTTPYFCPQSANTVTALQKVWWLLTDIVKAACRKRKDVVDQCLERG